MLIIPKVNGEIRKNRNGAFFIKGNLRIHIGKLAPSVVRAFAERLGRYCAITVSITDRTADLVLLRNSQLAPEEYELAVLPDQIRVSASTDRGFIWGLATVYQLIMDAQRHHEGRIDLLSIRDKPKYVHRGLHVDVARHFFGVVEMKRIIEEMSIYKLNVLHWHLSDDQGWRIESKVYPRLHEQASNGQYYTQEQIRDIVRFARDRGIDVIPEIDMPGHTSAAIAAYKELSCFDEEITVQDRYGVFRVVMCPGKESTYSWIYQFLDEVTALFPSPYLHIGGDECPKDRWRECPHCQRRMRDHGFESLDDLQGYFTNEISEYLRKKGKMAIGWNEVLKASTVSREIVVQYWLESTSESYSYPYYVQGQKMIFSDMFHFYFDYPHCMVKLRKTYEYEPKIREHARLAGDHILGLEGAVWTERIITEEQLESMISLRLQALAEAAWTVDRDYDDFLRRLKLHMQANITQLHALPLEEVALTDEQAMIQALRLMKTMASETKDSIQDTGLSAEEHQRISGMFSWRRCSAGSIRERSPPGMV